jgi:hypothetical protein
MYSGHTSRDGLRTLHLQQSDPRRRRRSSSACGTTRQEGRPLSTISCLGVVPEHRKHRCEITAACSRPNSHAPTAGSSTPKKVVRVADRLSPCHAGTYL